MDNFSYINNVNSAYTDKYTNQLGNKLENSLSNSDLSTASDEKLMDVCKDFEQYFVEQVMKSMSKMASVDGDKDSSLFSTMAGITSQDSGMKTMSNYFGDQYMTNITESICDAQDGEGLGVAQILYEQMRRNYNSN